MSTKRGKKKVELPEEDESFEDIIKQIGVPEKGEFVLDDFQSESIGKLKSGENNLLVIAPTGSGKTYIAESYIKEIFSKSDTHSIWYTTPMRALSNDKYHQFCEIFGRENIGIITGDIRENINAKFVIATTESYRNILLSKRDFVPDFVVVDELHFMNDLSRGKVWEEIIILTPKETKMLFLSATIGNYRKVREWIEKVRGSCDLVVQEENKRSVKLKAALVDSRGLIFTYNSWKKRAKLAPFDYKNLNGFVALTKRLESKNLLPAIFYIPTRKLCEEVVKFASLRLSPILTTEEVAKYIDEETLFLNDYERVALEAGFVQHHAGRSPKWRKLIEDLMRSGKLRVICATTTLSAGIDFPARTVFISTSYRPSDNGWVELSTNEIKQIAGRAGRRGKDKIGVVLLTNETMLENLYAPSDDIVSKFHPSYMLILNLVETYSRDEIKEIIENSFYYFTNQERIEEIKDEIECLAGEFESKKKSVRKHIHRLKQELHLLNYVGELLAKRLSVLQDIGYIKALGNRFILSQSGQLASNIKRDSNFLQLSVALVNGVFDRDAPILLGILFGRLAQNRLVTKSIGRYGRPLMEIYEYCRYYESKYGLKDEEFSYSSYMEKIGIEIASKYKRIDLEVLSEVSSRFRVEEGDLYKLIVDVRDLLYTLSDLDAPCSYMAKELIDVLKLEE
ncbi:MAG: DEAD/DEAH box helicase [Deltaproteobacteria bacterium]|nr:DEAD/DEAH box helicase [Deltaproteobacteria bacterium]